MVSSKKLILVPLSLVLSFLISMFIAIPASYAYISNNQGYYTAAYTLDMGYSRYNSTWTDRVTAAAVSWNTTASPAFIQNSASSSNKLYISSYADTWFGYYESYRLGGTIVDQFDIKLNSRTIGNEATNWNNFVESSTVHEMGHSLNLAHNSVTSIMNNYRDRNTMHTPQQDDIDGVNAYY